MREWIIEVMNVWGYGGIVFLIALENVFPPIPSEVILTFGGFMTTCTQMTLWGVVAAATLGAVIGAIILYAVGRLLGADAVLRLLDGKVGKMLHFNSADVQRTMEKFEERGTVSVLFCRCIPIVRSLISIPAGMSKMPLVPFLVLTTVGSAVWNTLLVYLGALAGNSWEKIAAMLGSYADVVMVVLMCAVPIVTWVAFGKKGRKTRAISR